MQTLLHRALQQSLVDLGLSDYQPKFTLTFPQDLSHGDLTTNLAMVLFASLSADHKKTHKSPRELASKIVGELEASQDLANFLSSISVAGPGFINFGFSKTFLWQQLTELDQPLSDQELAASDWFNQQVLVEFTDPNPFKELHIGHLFSNIVGESIARLLEKVGARVKRICYQGDVGMHVAKSVWGMQKKLASDSLTLADLAQKSLSERVKFLGQAYALGATAYEEDPSANQEIKEVNFLTYRAAQQRLIDEQGWQPQVDYASLLGDSKLPAKEISELYTQGRAWSLEYFETIYERLGTKFEDYFFESETGEYGMAVVKEHLAKGVFEKSQGAVIFPGSKHGLHDRVFINSLGLPTYETKELGLAPEKARRHSHDRSLIITANEIIEYFKVLLSAMSQTHPDLAAKTTHLTHGMVNLPEGKMSSRTGKILTAEWLLDEAGRKALDQLVELRPDWTDSERELAANQIGLGAVKYALLKSSIGSDIAFSFEESLSFTGHSGPYLQYSLVRCKSLLAKADLKELATNKPALESLDLDQATSDLWRFLIRYQQVVASAAHDFAPHTLANYLYELATKFSLFYDGSPILKEPNQDLKILKLSLVQQVAATLEDGLTLLGIPTPDRM